MKLARNNRDVSAEGHRSKVKVISIPHALYGGGIHYDGVVYCRASLVETHTSIMNSRVNLKFGRCQCRN